MKNSQISTFSKKIYSYTILDVINIKMQIVENPFDLQIDELFTMAGRINKKRSFLFVSKVLGKHIPIVPQKGLLTAALLGVRFAESVKGIECTEKEKLISAFKQRQPSVKCQPFIPKRINPLVIGFAETATGLGHAFFDCFETGEYFHTTREEVQDLEPTITFEEEHSHATSHRCYIPIEMINNEREIILVDDEMTTGKTALNIIQSIHKQFPRREYTVVSILDWRSEEDKQKFLTLEKKLGITIQVISLVAGIVEIKQIGDIQNRLKNSEKNSQVNSFIDVITMSSFFQKTTFSPRSQNSAQKLAQYIEESGRFGINSASNKSLHQKIAAGAEFLSKKRTGEKTLCLGTGEFMYIPMKLSAGLGRNVFYQSTTRSPIYVENSYEYGARYGFDFPNPEDLSVSHFVYNIPPGEYDELFIFFEKEVTNENLQPLLKQLNQLKIKSIKLVFLSEL